MVKRESKTKQLCICGLQFGGIIGLVERYWEAEPGLVCMRYCAIGHVRISSYGDQTPQYIIYNGLHKMEEPYCGIAGSSKGKKKICIHVTAKCVNCGGNHTANFLQCISRHKADLEAKKRQKEISQKEKEKFPLEDTSKTEDRRMEKTPEFERERREESPLAGTNIELESQD